MGFSLWALSWGVAPGWYDGAPLALAMRTLGETHDVTVVAGSIYEIRQNYMHVFEAKVVVVGDLFGGFA